MALTDRPIVRAGLALAEERLNVSLLPADRRRELEVREQEFGQLAQAVDELEFQGLDYFGGRPQELRPWARKRIAQRSRVALLRDPLAGAESQLLGDFSIGKGIPVPTAQDPKVQDAIDSAWSDANNQDKLTGYVALRKRSNELLTAGELFITLRTGGGSARVGRIDADRVIEIVTDPEDADRPLWYVTTVVRREWDFNMDQWKSTPDVMENGRPKVMYWKHWRNYDDAVREREMSDTSGEAPLETPPADKIAPGVVYHLPINQTGDQLRGNPPWARALRFFCHDEQTETLTADGWMGLPELRRRWMDGSLPRLAGFDRGRRRIVYEAPLAMADDPYDGDLLEFHTPRGFDLLVTPNHRMLTPDGIVEAAQIKGGERAPVGALLAGGDRREAIEIPGCLEHERYGAHTAWSRRSEGRQRRVLAASANGRTLTEIARDEGITKQSVAYRLRGRRFEKAERPPLTLSMDAVLAWLGWWIAEGDPRGSISQFATSARLADCQRACRQLGVEGRERYHTTSAGHRVWHWRPARPKQLVAWLGAEAGSGAHGKRVPRFVFDLPASQQLILLRALMGGDGTPTDWEDRGGRYNTVSEQLADDVQRLAVHCGFSARKKWIEREPYGMPGIWQVSISRALERALPSPTRRRYRGAVYCFTMPSDCLVTRRNGRVAISGNTAMNVLTESHVTMAQAASTFIARRVVRGTPNQVRKAANQVLEMAGELGAGRWGGGTSSYRYEGAGGLTGQPPGAGGPLAYGEEPATRPFGGHAPPFPPGSWWNENESSRLEALNLQSGAGQMAQSAQIVRAPIAAQSGFGQHYLGDASDANLATASTLELPATMHVTSWQELLEQLLRWFTDRAIEEALKAGRLGPVDDFDPSEPGAKPLSELRLQEAEDRAQLEKRVGKKLGYEFTMPFPGRRQLPDVTTFVGTIAQTMDPNGVNIPLRRQLLRFAYEQIGIDDIARAVEEAIPDKPVPGGIGPQDKGGGGAGFGQPAQPGQPQPGQPGGEPAGLSSTPPEGQQPYGARSNATPPPDTGMTEQEWIDPARRDEVNRMLASLGDDWRKLVEEPSTVAALALNAPSNGAGAPA